MSGDDTVVLQNYFVRIQAMLFNGTPGADSYTGTDDNDTYIINHPGDVVTEAFDGGSDTERSSITRTLDANVEFLKLTGFLAINGNGNELDNKISGNENDNRLAGLAGDDVLFGSDGIDTLIGGDGNDQLKGGEGNDILIGGGGNDRLDGGSGFDEMRGGSGNDTYIVDIGNDEVFEGAGAGVDTVRSYTGYELGANLENLVLLGTASSGIGNKLNNSLIGNVHANLLNGQAGADYMAGGKGNDSYVVDNRRDIVFEAVDSGNQDIVNASIAYTLPANVEILFATTNGTGNAGANTLYGNDAANRLNGAAGDDTIDGRKGDDVLLGDAGNDTLFGDSGNDLLNGGTGADTMKGGSGDDTYIVDNVDDVIMEQQSPNMENRVRASVDYTLSDGISYLDLLPGAVSGTGNKGHNVIAGNSVANTLRGMGGYDTIFGGGGDDIIIGGAQPDTLTGGGGADRFVFADGDFGVGGWFESDHITDFSQVQHDKIDLSAVDANAGMAGNQAFTFIGSGDFTHHAGQVRTYTANGHTIVELDLNGNGFANCQISLDTPVALTAADFVL